MKRSNYAILYEITKIRFYTRKWENFLLCHWQNAVSIVQSEWKQRNKPTRKTRRMKSHSFHVQHLPCVDIHRNTLRARAKRSEQALWHRTKKTKTRKLIRLHVINWFFFAGKKSKPKEIRMCRSVNTELGWLDANNRTFQNRSHAHEINEANGKQQTNEMNRMRSNEE